MKQCRECRHEVSEQAPQCPQCGAPYPARENWDGYGFEYRTKAELWGLPLLHVSFKFRPNRLPVPARGIIAIGQFGAGVVTLAQFGVGLVSVGQFCLGGWVLAQFAAGHSIVAQIGVYWAEGYGQTVWRLGGLLGS